MATKIPLIAVMVLASTFAFADGASLWKAKCASCHGANGEGKSAMKTPDMSLPATQKQTDAQLKTTISDGKKDKSTMPAYKGKLTDAEMDSLVQYIRTFKK